MKSSPRGRGAQVSDHLLRCEEGLSVGDSLCEPTPKQNNVSSLGLAGQRSPKEDMPLDGTPEVESQRDVQHGSACVTTPERIRLSRVRQRLTDPQFGSRLLYVPSCQSTNDVLWTEIKRGAPAGTVVTADRQTRGRGRMGRRWESAPGKDLLLSVAVPCDPIRHSALLVMWASVAAADMLIRQEGIDVALKWPNDLVARGRKLAGVLAETRSDQPLAVVGIGINVLSTSADRPKELRDRAVSLLELEYRGWDRSFMLANILNSLGVWWKVFCSQGWPAIYERWRQLSSIIGRRVRLQYLNESIVGIAEDIDPMGHLVLRAPDGRQYVVSAAEITDLVVIQGVLQNGPDNGG